MRARPGQDFIRAQTVAARPATSRLAALGLLGTVLGIAQAWCIAELAGPPLLGGTAASPWLWGTLFALVAVARAGGVLLLDARAFEAGAAARRRLRTRYMVAAFEAGPHAMASAGVGVTAAVDQVDGLEGFFARWLPASVLAWAGPLLALAVLLAVDPVAAGILAACGLAVPLGMGLAGLGAAAASQHQFEAMARLQSRFLDRVRGIATIVLAGPGRRPRRGGCARRRPSSRRGPCGCCGSRSCLRRCWTRRRRRR